MPKMTKLIVQTPAYDPAVSHRALRNQSCTKTTRQCIFFSQNLGTHGRQKIKPTIGGSSSFRFGQSRAVRFCSGSGMQSNSRVRLVAAQIKQDSSSVRSIRFVVLVVHIKQNSTSVRSVRVHLCC